MTPEHPPLVAGQRPARLSPTPPARPVALDVEDARLLELVDPAAELEPLATGFQFIEGPVWHPLRQDLIFSDIAGDCLYRWRPADGVTVFRRPSRMANGNTYDAHGRLVTCEHAASRVTRTEPDGSLTVLAAHYNGRELNSPNDVVVRSDGAIYFTDPNFGRRPSRVGVPRPQQQPSQAVFRVDPASLALTRLADDFGQPNGLCFSLDERQLYVNDSPRGHIRVFEVEAGGGLSGGQVWAEVRGDGPGVPDGLKVDTRGNVYCAGPGGLHVFSPEGAPLGRVRVPEQAANFTWGEADGRSLFIAASSTLYRLRVRAPGRPLFAG
ncbi:MAG: SMP-30/gluconolactonase/LRE family protein [Anaerolineales bacterium]|nr:SMP-30/gluconolactonase/LRE family protein [Anaerolineales bacterium]